MSDEKQENSNVIFLPRRLLGGFGWLKSDSSQTNPSDLNFKVLELDAYREARLDADFPDELDCGHEHDPGVETANLYEAFEWYVDECVQEHYIKLNFYLILTASILMAFSLFYAIFTGI
jgi:hypothetical protein